MPRYDDRSGNTRLYVGRLSSRTRSRDLEDLFSRYGRVRDVDMKHDFAFVEFRDPRDADDARYALDGRDFGGSRLIVEFARGGPRGPGGSREYLGRGPPPGSGRCFNCGIDGHWARDCKAGDWKNKCYRCGDRGHIERNCHNSPKELRRGSSYSRSASRSPSPRRRRSRSYSRSRSPPARRERERSKSPAYSRSPSRDASPPPKERRHSPSPGHSRSPRASRSPPPEERKKLSEERNGAADYSPSPRARDIRSPRDTSMSPLPKERKAASNERNGSDYEQSPRRGTKSRSRSPMSEENGSPYAGRRYRSPEATNGRSVSPRDDDEDVGRRPSPRGDESPQD